MKQRLHPGRTGKKPFYIQFDRDWFSKGDVLETDNGAKFEVIKVYRLNWWRKLLRKLGFRVRIFSVKVVEL